MNYDTHLFTEIIESVPNIVYLREQIEDGIKGRFYQGIRGNLVIIDCSDEDIDDETAKGYLCDLGLDHLIAGMFPSKQKDKEEADADAEILKAAEEIINSEKL